MERNSESQYKVARAIEDAGGIPARPVCFHAGAVSIGTLRVAKGVPERVIRFSLHTGNCIDVAMSHALARKLALALAGKGELQ
jgi:hypothetical protein